MCRVAKGTSCPVPYPGGNAALLPAGVCRILVEWAGMQLLLDLIYSAV